MEKIVLTQDEISALNVLQTEKNTLIEYYGILEVEYQTQKVKLNEELVSLNQKQEALGKELQEKYGDGVINIETGEFSKNINS